MASFPTTEQRRIIERVKGAHLVLAPAGSGKTQVMTARLARALAEGFAADRALCVTFTNRAAEEMRTRVAQELSAIAKQVQVKTFHGLCAWLLRRCANRFGLPRDFSVYDEQDAIEILGAVMSRSETRLRAEDPKKFFFRLSERKSNAGLEELSLERIPPLFPGPHEEAERVVAARYHRILADRAALDFSDLVYRVRSALELDLEERARVEALFDWIQIDEVQDTHFSEYDVIRRLALRGRNLALFGDIDQTIYEWRGSDPDSILGRFRRDFQPIEEHLLTRNFRATRRLLRIAGAFADSLARRRTRLEPDDSLPEGEPPKLALLETTHEEAEWIAKEAAKLVTRDPRPRVGILARTHGRLARIGEALIEHGVPHVTVEEFEFFRRQEIKDALARLRLVLHGDDSGALRRMLLRPRSGIGPATLQKLEREGPGAGLRLTDFARERTHDDGEPFARLLGAFAHETIVVFDVETTGLSTTEDEIVEIAAARIAGGKTKEEFHRLLRPTRKVGDSEAIHGHDDEKLAREGGDPRTVLTEFLAFVGESHVVGHNVRFDLSILTSQLERLGIGAPRFSFDDTLDLARRFLDAPRFDLETLATTMGLEHRPTHRALDDVRATAELLARAIPLVGRDAKTRERLVKECGGEFRPIARDLTRWRAMAQAVRPAAALRRILLESRLSEFYSRDAKRTSNLEELCRFFEKHDRPYRPPLSALSESVQFAALARNVDHLSEGDDRIPVVTVHQAKGLEFDVVFIAGLSDGEFPSFFATKEGRLEEEKRLFYVALTRARRALYLSGFRVNDRGMRCGASPFFESVRALAGKP